MKKIQFFWITFLTLICSSAQADQTFQLTDVVKLIIPSAFSVEKKQHPFSSTYQATSCVGFSSNKTKAHIGDFCISRNKNFLSDMGIMLYGSIPRHAQIGEKPSSEWVVVTPMFQYEMVRFLNQPVQSYSAIVDCDAGADVTYRATGDCHVAIAPLNDGSFLYSSFFTTKYKHPVSAMKDIKSIWQTITMSSTKSK